MKNIIFKPLPLHFRLLLPLLMAVNGVPVFGDVTLPALISDHAVLQKSEKTRIWGSADPGEKITVTLGGVKGETQTEGNGKWKVELNLSAVGMGPFDLSVAGKNQITVKDILVGEVWVASGQSNMEWPLKMANGAVEEVAASSNPQFRCFIVTKNAVPDLKEDCKGAWMVAGPETSEKFTAVGYFFSKKVQQTLKVPVGLIQTSWGGTPVEAWTSLEALNSQPELKEGSEKMFKNVADYDGVKKNFITNFQEWTKKHAREDKPSQPALFAEPKIDMTGWKKVTLPGKLKEAGLSDSGVVWIRKTIVLDDKEAKKNQVVRLAAPEGFETLYFNGKEIYTMPLEKFEGIGMPHQWAVGPGVEGENVIAVRLYNPKGGIGILGNVAQFKFGPMDLKGEWFSKTEHEFPALTEEAASSYPPVFRMIPGPQSRPGHLYNGMIQPVIPYTIQGAIWYQGEANAGRAYQYQISFPLMIQDWRKKWGSDFPFYFCQLANFQPKKKEAGESGWAELREAQNKTLSLPNTGQAILIDLGEADDIHPWNKKDVGERLALSVLAKTYGKDLIHQGPTYDSFKVEGDKIRITFKQPTGGLVARPVPETYLVSTARNSRLPVVRNSPQSELEGFMICGEDQKWVWADAKIEGENVVVWSSTVVRPVAVRYAWADNPTVNLYNASGLPASPFKTDDFAWTTEKSKF